MHSAHKPARPAAAPTVRVAVYSQHFTKSDIRLLSDVLGNRREGFGSVFRFWFVPVSAAHPFQASASGKQAAFDHTIVITKLSSARIRRMYPGETHVHNMSFTYVGRSPTAIVFNADNWDRKPDKFTLGLEEYRTYLINHEFGHALGLFHHQESSPSRCPLMYQQTRGTTHCERVDLFPSASQRQQVLSYVQNLSVNTERGEP